MTRQKRIGGSGELKHALRSVRRARGLTARDVATAMGLPLRTYGNFESGTTAATARKLHAFATFTGCDYAALLLCSGGHDARLALASMDNKAVSIAIGAIEDLTRSAPDALASLTGADLMAAFDESRDRLRRSAAGRVRTRGPDAGAEVAAPLTRRQLQCLQWAQAGKSANDIGAILGISRRTAETHLAKACERLQVRTRIQAISRAIELGLLSPRSP